MISLLIFLSFCLSTATRLDNDINIVVGEPISNETTSRLVIGGSEAPRNKYRYTSGLRETASGASFCGGTLIAPKFILTAAHCAQNINYVAVGTHYRSQATDGLQIRVARVIAHPSFNNPTMANDIAIVELSKAIKNHDWIAHLGETVPADGSIATLHGWGRVSYPGSSSEVLKEVDLPIVSASECQRRLGSKVNVDIHASMICAGGKRNEAACHGDSGGPLVLHKNKTPPVLVGDVSFGQPCGTGAPDAFGRISYFKDFIDQHVTGHTWVKV